MLETGHVKDIVPRIFVVQLIYTQTYSIVYVYILYLSIKIEISWTSIDT